MWRIVQEDPEGADLTELFARHTADMHAQTPPESIHMLAPAALKAPDIRFYVMRAEDGEAVAMGAIRRLSSTEGEVKSMHVLQEVRGMGVSRLLLEHLVQEALAAGLERLSLETGIEPIFAAARNLYSKAGFEACGPFGDYSADPNSLFMTRRL